MLCSKVRLNERNFTSDILNDIMKMMKGTKGNVSVWNYSETDAYNSIGLHDCKSDNIRIEGADLIFEFPDGFKLCPVNKHNENNFPVMTGAAQLCFHGLYDEMELDSIYVYKAVRLFRQILFCRRKQLETSDFLKFFEKGKYKLEFLNEWHAPMSTLYKCLILKKDSEKRVYECEFEITARNIEYRYNEIHNEDAS